ncbi:MAG: LysM peptidoglycan-binding domain-containing protein [Gemmatimonadetes bacterium]|nr:LysM peptidoglycan-binding domain-containing protein [Gemmatimonadota bacterium]
MTEPGISRRPLRVALPLALVLLAVSGTAQEPATQDREHVVRRGDTLWDLAGHYLGNPFLWPMIYEANRAVVENPHWIYPGERLRIPGVPGEAAAAPAAGQPVQEQPAAAAGVPGAPAAAPARGAAGAAVTLDLRRPVIPPAEYYATPWVEPAAAERISGRVIGLADQPSTARDKIPPVLHPNYRVNIGELRGRSAQAGDTLQLVRVGRDITGYGQVIEPLALVLVDSVGSGVLRGRLTQQFAAAAVGDLVMPLERMPEIPVGRAEPVAGGTEGQLLEFLAPQQLYGTGSHGFVTVNGGALRLGDELAVYVPGAQQSATAAVVPPVEVARARVVRLAARAATVRLTGVFDTSVRPGLPVRLIARMP